MTTTFNGWRITQKVEKVTKEGPTWKLKLQDMSDTHKLTISISEEEYRRYKVKDLLPSNLIKGLQLEIAEKDQKETATATKHKLTLTDDESGAKLKLDINREGYEGSEVGDSLEQLEPLYQSKIEDADKAEVTKHVN